jgi:hypothetical protein
LISTRFRASLISSGKAFCPPLNLAIHAAPTPAISPANSVKSEACQGGAPPFALLLFGLLENPQHLGTEQDFVIFRVQPE